MIKFSPIYAVIAAAIFAIEVYIALYVTQPFIRGYMGDVLVVALIYCTIRSVCRLSIYKTATFVLAFAFCVEVAQALNIVSHLGLENNRLAKIIIGTHFSFADLIPYALGIAAVLLVEWGLRLR